MNAEYTPTKAFVMKEVPRDEQFEHGVAPTDTIEVGKPTLIVFGGDMTYKPQNANYYIKRMRKILDCGDVKDVNIYAAYYFFGLHDYKGYRATIFKAAGHKIKHSLTTKQAKEVPTPDYIQDLFEMLFLPLIVNKEKALENVSKVRIFAHSHGAMVARVLGDFMAAQMRKMGYAPDEIKKIQQNIVVIQHGPTTPLENPRFTTLSFGSAEDIMMDMHNRFSKYAYDNSIDMYPSYFSQGGARLFATYRLAHGVDGEHGIDGLTETAYLTDDGKIIHAAERNAIVNSLRAAANNQPMPTVESLVSSPGVNFQEMKSNGEYFYGQMLRDIKRLMKQNPKHANQK